VTHDELKALAKELAQAESVPPLDECYGISRVIVPTQAWLTAKALACFYIGGGWNSDFTDCPRDRPVMLLWWTGDKVAQTAYQRYFEDYCPSHWMEFTPPHEGTHT
jgi:hypothetical protein